MSNGDFHGRRASSIENEYLRVTVLAEGGHIAEILDKETGINPLWVPPWKSIEPSMFDPVSREYGDSAEAKLLAGIMGHNLCLDIFGGPSAEEAAAGLTVHGEGSMVPYDIRKTDDELICCAHLPEANLRFERRLSLSSRDVRIRETVENLLAADRPIAWTQHVTLGPPFLERGVTEFRLTATRSKVFESAFGVGGYLKNGAEFDWPMAPRIDGGEADLQTFTSAMVSSAYTAHRMDPSMTQVSFRAWEPNSKLEFGYRWTRTDFPWLGIWEENRSRANPPWNGNTLARGMEFGVSPMPETRRAMIERGRMFDTPCYRWLPAKGSASVEYWAGAMVNPDWPERHEAG